jgi:hypothetical protein
MMIPNFFVTMFQQRGDEERGGITIPSWSRDLWDKRRDFGRFGSFFRNRWTDVNNVMNQCRDDWVALHQGGLDSIVAHLINPNMEFFSNRGSGSYQGNSCGVIFCDGRKRHFHWFSR